MPALDTFAPLDTSDNLLAKPLQFIKGVGPKIATKLQLLQLETLRDLLLFFPIDHKDRASITPISRVKVGGETNLVAQILDVKAKTFNGKTKIEAFLQDESGDIRGTWWNPYIVDRLTPHGWAFFSGKITQSASGKRAELSNAEFEVLESPGEDADAGDIELQDSHVEEQANNSLLPGTHAPPHARARGGSPGMGNSPNFGRIVPVYNLRPKQRMPDGKEAPEIRITQSFVRKIVWNVLETNAASRLPDQIPEALRTELQLMPLDEAIRQIHFPQSFDRLKQARRRLVFEELFVISLGVALRRHEVQRHAAPQRLPLTPAIEKRIHARLPFQLTPSQSRVFREIAQDMGSQFPMNRLLQGDVGSGKTAVALSALLLCVAHGGQAALLAPTEVLAAQHARTISTLLKDSRVNIGLLRGGSTTAERRDFLERLASGEIHIAIGTHALLEPGVTFKTLSLLVVDEQHKFGVAQRMQLRAKGRSPHVLVMTATPIPRTLTLTLYGDLDVSRIDEPPPGRGEIVSRWLKEVDRAKVYRMIVTEARKGHATYIVLPRIDEDSAVSGNAERASTRLWSEVKGVEEEFKRMKEHLPTLRIGMLHGRLPSEEKDRVIAELRAGRLDVLISTQLIEVGIDLPSATVMMIENAEMFGLSALHQLRGRVGRSELKSYCFVFGEPNNPDAEERIKTFVKTRDGFEIAEADFKLRGPGQFFGTQQSGMPELKIADLMADTEVLVEARTRATELVRADPTLSKPEHAPLRQRIGQVLGVRLGFVDVG
jgi:ATP-dependent DNA helicase RecG